MRVTKVGVKERVLSIDTDSTAQYLAAGTASGRVFVYALAPLLETSTENTQVTKSQVAAAQKPAATIQCHTDEVAVVKFCPGTQTLLSGDVRGRVFVTDFANANANANATLAAPKSELLCDLEKDAAADAAADTASDTASDVSEPGISDLEMSPDGAVLAIATRNTIHVYSTENKAHEVTPRLVLKECKGHVKSIAFSPAGHYLSAVCNDNCVYVYQYTSAPVVSFKLVETMSKMLKKHLQATRFARTSWSPQGHLLAVPNSTKEVGKDIDPAVLLKEKNRLLNFSTINLGTTNALTNVSAIAMCETRAGFKNRFSLVGHRFSAVEALSFCPIMYSDSGFHNVVASGGIDKCLVVWSTAKEKPLFVAQDFAENSISDLCWVLPRGGPNKAESAPVLAVASLDGTVALVAFSAQELGTPASAADLAAARREVSESVVPIARAAGVAGAALAVGSSSSSGNKGGSSGAKPKSESKKESPPTHNLVPPPSKQPTPTSTSKVPAVPVPAAKKVKKRVAPSLVTPSGGGRSSHSNSNSSVAKSAAASDAYARPSHSVTKSVVAAVQKRQREKDKEAAENSGDVSKKPRTVSLEPLEFVNTAVVDPMTATAKLRLGAPRVATVLKIDSCLGNGVSLVVKNGTGNEQKPSRVFAIASGGDVPSKENDAHQEDSQKELFVDFLPKFINLATSAPNFWALATLDGQIHVYNPTGQRAMPVLVLGTAISFLEAKNEFLMAVTCTGVLHVWNVSKRKIHCGPVDLYPLFEPGARYHEDVLVRGENMTLCSITSRGMPVVTLSNGSGYIFSDAMRSWLCVADSWWAFGSQYWDSENAASIGGNTGNSKSLLHMLEKKSSLDSSRRRRAQQLTKVAKVMLMKHGYENLETSVSLAHLENKLMVSEILHENEEFKKLLIGYCVRLSELVMVNRLNEVLSELLGPGKEAADPEWQDTICGHKKHELLKEVVLACAKVRKVQEILVEYAKEVGLLDQL